MAKRVEDQDGLTPREAKACLYRVQNMTQSDAYRKAFNKPRASAKTVNEKACRLFARPATQAWVRDLLQAAKVQDLLSAGAWLDQLKADVATARADGNHNAVMNGTRLLGQALGVLKDTVNVSVEQRASDSELIDQLAKDDPNLAAAFRKSLGAADTFGDTRH